MIMMMMMSKRLARGCVVFLGGCVPYIDMKLRFTYLWLLHNVTCNYSVLYPRPLNVSFMVISGEGF